MAGLYDLLISNAAAQSRTAPPAPSIKDTVEPAPPMTADEIDLATSGEAALGATAGVSQVKGMVKGALAATAEALSAPKFGQSLRSSANADMAEAQQISSYSSAPQSLKDVGGVGDFLDYARFGVAKQAPQLGAMAGAALVGGGAGVTAMGVGMNAGAQYLDGNAEIDELRAQNLVTPERESQLRTQVLEKSGMAGAIMGALDRIGFGAVAPRLVGGVAASLPRQVLKAMGQEGGTELVQEYIGNVATKLALEKPDAYGITPDEMWQLADAGVLGGLTGGAMAVPGGSFSRVGQGIDKAVDLAGAAVNRFRPDDNAAAGGVAPTPGGPAGPSAGGRLGMALRGLIDTDPEVIKQAAGQQFDQLLQNEYVQRAVQEGKDFLGELRQSSRLQKLDAFEQQVADGFKQFTDAFGERAQTDNIEAAYARYKEMLARSGIDFSKVDPAKAGNAAGAAVAGFNDWLGRTEYAARSIFEGAQEGFNNPGENRTTFGDTTYETAARAGEAARAATDFAKAATDTVGRYAKAGAGMAKDAFKAAAEAMRKDVGPIEGAEYTVDTIAGQLQRPTGKQSVVAGRDVKLVEDTFRQLGAKDSDAVRFIARRLAPMLTDRKVFDSFMSSQATIDAFKSDLGLYPHQVASLLYLNLRENGMDTEAESLGYMGMPPAESTLNEVYGKQQDEAGPQLAEDQVDQNNDAGVSEVEQQTLADAKAEVGNDRIGALQNKALAPGEAAKAAFERMQAGTFRGAQGSQRWVVKTRTVKDPATGAVLEQTSEPVKINMMDVAMAESGARSRRPNETKQQRKDADWMSGVASVFNGWQETDEQGRTVEVTVQPGKQTSVIGPDGKKVDSAEPVDTPLKEWIRPREVVGAGERTFDQLQRENRANKPLTGLPVAVEQYVTGIQAAQENGVKDLLGYEMTLINAAVDAVREARFPQDLRMAEATDLKAYERELETMVNFVDNVEPSPQVDGMWALLRDPTMPQEVKDVLLTNITRAIQADNIGAMDTSVSTPPAELRAKRRELLATPPSERGTESFVQGARDYALGVVNQVANALGDDNVYPAALTLLPSDIVKKQDESGMALITRRLFGAIRNSESIRNDTTSLTDNPTQPAEDLEVYAATGRTFDEAGEAEARRFAKETGKEFAPADPRKDVSARTNTISGKGGLRMYDEEGPVTEDLAGQYIDYDAAEKAGREQGREAIRRREARKVKGMTPEQINIPPVRKKPRADAERSVVTAVREAAVSDIKDARSKRTMARAQKIADGMDDETFNTLQNDTLVPPSKRSILPASLKDSFREWFRDSGYGEEMMAPENQVATETKFLEELAEGDDPREAAMAKQILANGSAGPEVSAKGPKDQAGPSGSGKKYSLYRSPLEVQLERTLAETGFALEKGAPDLDEVGTLIDIARKSVKLSNDPASLKQAAQGLSMLMVGHEDFEALRPELEKTGLYKQHLEAVKGTQSRADQEAARRTLADLISSNFVRRATIESGLIDKIKAFASRVWDTLANRVAPQLADAVDKMVEKMLNDRGYLVQKDKEGYEPVNFQSAIDSDPLAGSILAAAATTPAALTGSLAYATQTRVLRPKNAAIHDIDFKVSSSEEAQEFMAKMVKAFPGMRKVNSFRERGGYEVGTMLVPPPGTKFLDLTKNSYYLVDDAGKKVGYFKKTSDGEEGWGKQAKSVDLFVDPKPAAAPTVDHTFTQGGKQHTLKIFNVTDGVAAKLRILRPKDIWDYQKYNPRLKRSLYEGEGGLDLTTPEGRDEARRRIREIAGNVGIAFGTENSYDPEGHLITLAVSRFADLGTAYHEAVHAIFKAIEANDKATLYAGLNTMHVRNQLKQLLRDSPAALEAALNDPEELAAYAFQFYKRGMLRLGPETATWLDKLVKVIEDVKNWLLDQPGHEELFQKIAEGYYKNGGPSPMELAALRESKGAARRIVSDTARGLLAVYDKLLSAVDDRLRAAGVSELTDIAKEFYTQVGEKTSRRGMAQEIPIMTNIWMNQLAKVLGDNAGVAAAALEEMALGNEDSPKAKELRRFLNQMRTYMRQAGVDVGYIEGYLPMQWSGDKIADDEAGFVAMLEKYTPQLKELGLTPQRAWAMMSQRNISSAIPSGDVFDPDGKPTMWHSQERVFSFLSAEDRRPYVEDNLIGTLGQYVKQAVKRAEWERRFPGNSWEKALTAAEKRGATAEDIAIAKDLKEAVFGAKYNRMNPTWRRALGAVQTYQNVRVLGLSLFSSVADPLAIGVRTGDFKEAWNAFKYGMRHIYKAPQGDLNTLAEDIGVVNELGNLDSLMTLYGGFEVEGNLKHVNDMLFKYNGLEGLTRGLRVYAAGAGVRFVQRANTRQLAELGLKSDDLKYMPDGTLAVRSSQFKELGATNQEAVDSALKMQRALNRFVDESILRPNAAERPKWANDPVFALLFHLKQFIFSFHKIVSKKVMHEIEEGNMEAGTYLSAAAFVPLMAATGYMKDLIQYAGTVPEDRDFMHYLVQGVNRSGFMGPSVLASDVGSDLMSGQNPIGSVGGPAVSQALEALQALANPDRFSGFVEEALPLSSIYKRWND